MEEWNGDKVNTATKRSFCLNRIIEGSDVDRKLIVKIISLWKGLLFFSLNRKKNPWNCWSIHFSNLHSNGFTPPIFPTPQSRRLFHRCRATEPNMGYRFIMACYKLILRNIMFQRRKTRIPKVFHVWFAYSTNEMTYCLCKTINFTKDESVALLSSIDNGVDRSFQFQIEQ